MLSLSRISNRPPTAIWPPCRKAGPEPAALKRGTSCVIDRPARRVWGAGRVTLLGDAIHATTPNLGQGACQAVEDAVVLADSLRRCSSSEAGLRIYEALRRRRANYLIRQSRRVGIALQLSGPAGVWLRKRIGSTHWAQKRTEQLFDHALRVDLPELAD